MFAVVFRRRLFAGLLAFVCGLVRAEPGTEEGVALRAALACPTYDERSRECLLLKVDYSASGTAPAARPTLNIALVLDQSASMMADRKLAYTLDAARWVVQNLTERDVLSIVAFNDQTTVLSAAGRVVNKPFLYHRLEEVLPTGYTDLGAGLMEGIAQVRRLSAQGQIRRVFVLTDGQANRGEVTQDSLRKIVQQAAAVGIGVSTFGVGVDFNERLLADLALSGAGRYTYIRTPERIPTAFRDELGGLLQVMAKDAVIRLTLTEGHIRRIYGLLPGPPARSEVLRIGELRATERGFLLAELEPSAFTFGTSVRAEVQLDFRDPRTNAPASRVIRLRASYASEAEAASRGRDSGSAMLAAVLRALEQADTAARGLDFEGYREVRASFGGLYERAREYAIRTRDQELLNQVFVLRHFMEELDAAEQQGLLHGHEEAQEQLGKESHYLQYLLTHHRPEF